MNLFDYLTLISFAISISGIIGLRFSGKTKEQREAGICCSKGLMIFLAIGLTILFLLLSLPARATDYWGCASASINADSTFCTTPTGSCTGTTPVTAATALQAGNNLYANGCTISLGDSFTAGKISTEQSGSGVAGGGYTLAINSVSGKTFTTKFKGGTTACLSITGTGAGTPVDTIVGDIEGGSASGAHGVTSAHVTGTIQVTGNLTGGSSSSSCIGYTQTGGTGQVNITGNSNAGSGSGGHGISYSGTVGATVNGNCVGNDSVSSIGCNAAGASPITVIGNIIHGKRGAGANGSVIFNPGASNYILYPATSSYTLGTIDTNAVMIGPADDGGSWNNSGTLTKENEIKTGKNIGTALGTYGGGGGGGGAWAF